MAALALAACAASEPVAPQAPNVTGSVAARSAVAAAGVLGNGIGTGLDERDRQLAFSAEMRALDIGEPGEPVGWRGHPGRYGTVVPGGYYETRGTRCRDYSHTIYIDGKAADRAGDGLPQSRRDLGAVRLTAATALFLNAFLTPGC